MKPTDWKAILNALTEVLQTAQSFDWDIPKSLGEIREVGISQFLYIRDIPSVIKDGLQLSGRWDIPNVTKDVFLGSAGKGLLCVITVLQITTPPYGLIIDLSI